MRAGPPKIIEGIVGLLTPAASREHLLGDLQERYRGVGAYLADATSAVPGAIAGRVLRTVDWQLMAIQAGALYLAFVAAAWAAAGPAYLFEHRGFLSLLLPVALAMFALMTADVYGCVSGCAPVVEASSGIGAAVLISHAELTVPVSILFTGGALGVVLISSLRMWFPPSGNRPRGEVL